MLPYKNVYSLQDGRLVKNQDNKIEYVDENGKKRIITNPTYKDFESVGKYPLKPNEGDGTLSHYKVENGYIVPVYEETENNDEH